MAGQVHVSPAERRDVRVQPVGSGSARSQQVLDGPAHIKRFRVRRRLIASPIGAPALRNSGFPALHQRRRRHRPGRSLLDQNDEEAMSRRYMTLEMIGALSQKPIMNLSALAA